MEKQASIETGDPALKEGLNAYALQQAALRWELANHFEWVWQDMVRYIEIGGGVCTGDSSVETSIPHGATSI